MNLVVVETLHGTGAAYARNLGARHATGNKLIFVDADDMVAPGYLAAMARGLSRFDFVTSAYDHRTLNPVWVQRAHGPTWRDEDDPIPPLFGFLPFAGGSIGVTRAVFDRVHGFPEDFRIAQDIAFSWSVQLTGTELGLVNDAVYRVRIPLKPPRALRQTIRWGSALPLLYRRYRRYGMRRRPLSRTLRLWLELFLGLARARSRADLAPLTVQVGLLLGRLVGSVRHRTLYL